MRQRHHDRRQALLLAVELADLNLRADGGMGDVDASERNRLAEDRRARGAGDNADLGAANMDAIAVADRVVRLYVETDHQVARMLLAAQERLAADKIVLLGF